jgi:hypothetical protein
MHGLAKEGACLACRVYLLRRAKGAVEGGNQRQAAQLFPERIFVLKLAQSLRQQAQEPVASIRGEVWVVG